MIKTIRTMNEHQLQAVVSAVILALCVGFTGGFAAKALIDRIDSKDQALAWFHKMPQTERNDFVYTHLMDEVQQRWFAWRWCATNGRTELICRQARMANPIKAEDVK